MPGKNLDSIRKSRREWYERNQTHAKEQVKRRKQETYEWLKEYKSTLSCETCGEDHPACLDFHHRDPNEKEIPMAKAVASGWGRERILKEIEKCAILCSNCHRKLHFELRSQDSNGSEGSIPSLSSRL